ncbi:DUF1284 domain-containing protein [Candidatus Soleaferrea massiliensis]|uniref:DUF1284 domain-containing protein n=1 Tax=Candidatus Soleaferrea massiliensis TaxID=1470354 RepID=UPI000694A83B|nr:DUF1284 domain-containing protein [Candidatus Soleaferrea massiliensis]
MIRLRHHHLMCMHTYSGTGYSGEFCRNMERILQTLRQNPDTAVMLSAACDDICGACPNRIGGRCREEASIQKRDAKVAAFFNCGGDIQTTYRQLLDKIGPAFSKLTDVSQVCHRCEFYELCNAVLPKKLL